MDPLAHLEHREPQFVVSVVSLVQPVRLAQLVPPVVPQVAHLHSREVGRVRSSGQQPEQYRIYTPREPRASGVDPSDGQGLIALREMLRKKNLSLIHI